VTAAALLLALVAGLATPSPQAERAGAGEAVRVYRRGVLETARSLWLEELGRLPRVEALDAERGRILYNLGNVAFRRGDVLEAAGWYTSSVRLRPRDRDAWHNLEHARSTARLDPADRGDLLSTLQRLLGALTRSESAWLVIATAILWSVALLAEALRGGRLWQRLSWTGFALVLASLAPLLYHRWREGRDPVLLVGAEERGIDVRSEPRPDAAVVATLARGLELERVDELPEWTRVGLPAGSSGWVRRETVFPLER